MSSYTASNCDCSTEFVEGKVVVLVIVAMEQQVLLTHKKSY